MCVVSAILICVVSLVLQQQMNKFCYRVILDVMSVHRSCYPKIYRVEMGFASFRLACSNIIRPRTKSAVCGRQPIITTLQYRC